MLVFDPPSVMEFTWGTDLLRIELAADGAGTVLTLTDTFDDVGKAARDAAGWHECLDLLVSDLDGTPPPAPGRYLAEGAPGLREHARTRGLHHRPASRLERASNGPRPAMKPREELLVRQDGESRPASARRLPLAEVRTWDSRRTTKAGGTNALGWPLS